MYEKTKKEMREATEKGRNGKRFLNLLKCFQSYLHKCFQAYLRKCFQLYFSPSSTTQKSSLCRLMSSDVTCILCCCREAYSLIYPPPIGSMFERMSP